MLEVLLIVEILIGQLIPKDNLCLTNQMLVIMVLFGVKVVPELTGANVPFAVRARVCLLRDLGSACSPDNAFAIIQGLETVALRMKQHCTNAEYVVDFLKKHKEVTKVIYSTEHDKPIAERAKQYLKGGNGPMVGIELKGGIEAGKRFIESLKMFYHVANIGDARSLAIHPASTTHSQLNEKELAASGVTQSYVRLLHWYRAY